MTQVADILNQDAFFKYITTENPTNDKSSETASTGYVDDINYVSSNSNLEELERTTNDLNKLVSSIFEENRLKVNTSKTQILQVESNTTDVLQPNLRMISI